MKLYAITVTADLTDLDTLAIKLSADVEIPDESLRGVVMTVLPAHLRKVAADTEALTASVAEAEGSKP